MRTCGFCKWLKNDLCEKGYPITPFDKIKGFKRPKQCTKKQNSVTKERQSKDSYLNKQLDKLWSQAVRKRGYCEYCGKRPPEVVLHAHHIFSRRHFATRWDIQNGISLCNGCHLYKAHKDIQEFADWVTQHYGPDYIDDLRQKSRQMFDLSKEEKTELIEQLKKYLTN